VWRQRNAPIHQKLLTPASHHRICPRQPFKTAIAGDALAAAARDMTKCLRSILWGRRTLQSGEAHSSSQALRRGVRAGQIVPQQPQVSAHGSRCRMIVAKAFLGDRKGALQ
jgi:hypothetical protein